MRCAHLLLLSILLFPESAISGLSTGIPLMQHFGAPDYGADAQNWAVTQDHRGVIFVGNNTGILEYDGITWRFHQPPAQTVVRSLAVDSTGRIYAGAAGNFGYLAPDSIGALQFASLLPQVSPEDRDFSDVWKIYVTPDGVYFQATNHIFRWNGQTMKTWRFETKSRTYSHWVNGRYYIQQREVGLMILDNDELSVVCDDPILTRTSTDVIEPFGEHDILIGTRNEGLFIFDGERLRPFPNEMNAYFKENALYRGCQTPDGEYALATLYGGLVILNAQGQMTNLLSVASGFPEDQIYFPFYDKQGGLWLGHASGVSRVEIRSPFTLFDREMGIRSDAHGITSYNGTIYAATKSGVDVLLPGAGPGQRARFESVFGIDDFSFKLTPYSNGILASSLAGTYHIIGTDATFIRASTDNCFLARPSLRDPNRILCGIQSAVGVAYNQNGAWIDEGRIEIGNFEVRSIGFPDENHVWLGSEYDQTMLIDFSAGFSLTPHLTHFGQEDGLPGSKSQVFELNDNRLVFGTEKGLYKFVPASNQFEIETAFGQTLASDQREIFSVTQDAANRVWVASRYRGKSELGVARPQDDGSYDYDGQIGDRVNHLLGYNEECSIHVDADGIVWTSAAPGVFRFDPSRVQTDFSQFSTVIRRIMAQGDSLIFGGYDNQKSAPVVLPHRLNALRFEFAATSFDQVDANQYQFILDGFDAHWSSWTLETRKDYTNLPDGSYTFRVRAKNIYGKVSPDAIYHIRILPPFWLSWWFIALMSVLVGGLGLSGYKYRTRMLRRRAQMLEEQVQDRTRELQAAQAHIVELEKSALEKQMAGGFAHEMRNALSGVSISISTVMQGDHSLCHSNVDELHQLYAYLEDKLPEADLDAILKYLATVEQNEEAIHRVLKVLQRSADRAMEVTTLILEYSKLGRNHVGTDQIDLAIIIREVMLEHTNAFAREGIQMSVHGTTEVRLTGNESHFHSIINNIVINARDALATVERRDDKQIEFILQDDTTDSGKSIVTLTIRDNANGIPQKYLDKIFTPFFSTKPSTGTGLGLNYVQRLVQMYDGHIQVDGQPGKGTDFKLTFAAHSKKQNKRRAE